MKTNVPENILSLEACKILKEMGFNRASTEYFKQIPGTDEYEFVSSEEFKKRNQKDGIVSAYDADDLDYQLSGRDEYWRIMRDEEKQCIIYSYHKEIKFVGNGDIDSLEKRAAEYIVKKRFKLDDEDVRIV